MYDFQSNSLYDLSLRRHVRFGKKATIVVTILILVAAIFTIYFLESQQGSIPLSSFKIERVQISTLDGKSTISGFVYVAVTASQQAQGFQGAKSFGNCNGVAENESDCLGMIFAFTVTQNLCFYMHNTIIPLQQVWISSNGTVATIYEAQPETDATVCHSGMFVLETNPDIPISIGDRVVQSVV